MLGFVLSLSPPRLKLQAACSHASLPEERKEGEGAEASLSLGHASVSQKGRLPPPPATAQQTAPYSPGIRAGLLAHF